MLISCQFWGKEMVAKLLRKTWRKLRDSQCNGNINGDDGDDGDDEGSGIGNDVDDDEMGGGGCNAVALKLVN